MGLPKMKYIKRISLFLFTASMMFGAGSYATLKMEQFFYPYKYGQSGNTAAAGTGYEAYGKNQTQTSSGLSSEEKQSGSNISGAKTDKERVIEAAAEDIPVITADTKYMVEEINLSDESVQESEEEVPVKYIGLDRTSLILELEEYNKNPPLSELKRGFENLELAAFSKDRVVICKYYRTEAEEKGFYLMVVDHFVIVYEDDRETLYMNTDIMLENLSSELQEQIIEGKYIQNEQDLYNFLESYSS